MQCELMPLRITELWFHRLSSMMVRKKLSKFSNFSLQRSAIFHFFSGATSAMLPTMLHLLSKGIPLQLKGIVFDSSPIEYNSDAGISSIRLVQSQRVMNPIIGEAILGLGLAVSTLVGPGIRNRTTKALSSEMVQVPQLFLYSKRDSVAPSNYIEHWMKVQQEKGVSVQSHCWKDSEHVRHFIESPDLYRKLVSDFIKTEILQTRSDTSV